ncbi:pyridoxamine 5'-phosphate oxidase family protein [Streptomyces sp. NP160]|uniref:pyridoxamine 5'-phosphate oxidase family protein n=1 Tax=Streptomyces sp. NP160 TaxID=2586637 RepID=UPI001118E966|nr:pyridoxamine 5'-phosphate oxidase family protein [Streptomyces sp. NP160]TNM70293.1 pyridoxamine 5'-phosphate oxidase family protein [Streptomyces sp. NP160]
MEPTGPPTARQQPSSGRPPSGRSLVVLDDGECWTLLRSGRLGRLVYTDGALPAVAPVSYAVVGEAVVLALASGGQVATAARGCVVAFEVDDTDQESRTGWSVTAVGPAQLVDDPHLAARLRDEGLVPWVSSATATYLSVAVRVLSGRRLVQTPRAGG